MEIANVDCLLLNLLGHFSQKSIRPADNPPNGHFTLLPKSQFAQKSIHPTFLNLICKRIESFSKTEIMVKAHTYLQN